MGNGASTPEQHSGDTVRMGLSMVQHWVWGVDVGDGAGATSTVWQPLTLSFPPKKQHAQLSMASEHQMPASKQQPASSKVSLRGQDTPNPLWAFQLQLQCWGDHAAALPFGVLSVIKAF